MSLTIGPDKPERPKRRLTSIAVSLGPYLLFDSLCGAYCVNCDFTGSTNICSRKADQLAMADIATMHG